MQGEVCHAMHASLPLPCLHISKLNSGRAGSGQRLSHLHTHMGLPHICGLPAGSKAGSLEMELSLLAAPAPFLALPACLLPFAPTHLLPLPFPSLFLSNEDGTFDLSLSLSFSSSSFHFSCH